MAGLATAGRVASDAICYHSVMQPARWRTMFILEIRVKQT
jgi:hypothetical protein